MRLQVLLTTDGKHIGKVVQFDPGQPLELAGFLFRPQETIELGRGHWRFSNPHYTIDTKTIEET